MKKINFKAQVLPHLIVIAVFLLLVTIYFEPAVLGGKSLKQSDAVQWAGNAQAITEHREKFNEEPLWTNALFAGMPAYTISVLYSGELLEYAEQFMRFGLPYPVSIIFVGLVCFYILLLAWGVRPAMAAVGAIAFTFFTFNFISIEAGHNSKLRAMVFSPLVLAGVVLAFRSKWLWGFIITAIGIAFQIRAGHYQITYYLAILIGIYGMSELVFAAKDGRLKPFFQAVAILVAAVILGISTNAARLLVLEEYTKYSMRGKPELTPKDDNKPKDGGLDRDYVFSWSNAKMETFTLMIPGFYGGSSQEPVDKKSEVAKTLRTYNVPAEQVPALPYYWGDQPFTSGPVYAGAIICFLFVLGLFVLDARQKYWLLAAALASIVLTWGRNLPSINYFLYDHLPAYNKFRAVTMAIFIAQMAIPVMAILALRKVLESDFSQDLQKKLMIATGVSAGLALVFALIPSIAGDFTTPNDTSQQLPDWLLSAMQQDREKMLRSDAFRSFFLMLIASGILWASIKGMLKPLAATIIIGVLVLGDLWMVDKKYLNKENFEKRYFETHFVATAADNAIKQDPALYYRVLNLQNPFNESRTSYFHNSIGGYSPVKLRRYQDLIEHNITTELGQIIQAIQTQKFSIETLKNSRVLNMLNTKYLKASDDATGVIQNPYAMGNAWFVSQVQYVNNPDEELAALDKLDPATTAVVDKNKFTVSANTFDTTGSKASIKLTAYKANELQYESNNPNKGLAIFSDVYYPEGWQIKIDGQEAKLIRANYILRGLEIPAGKHTISFVFKPTSFTLGNTVSLFTSVLVLGLFFGAILFSFKNEKAEKKAKQKI